MTRADQIIERDGQVNIGGEWLSVAPPPTGEELVTNIERAATALLGEPVSADLYERGNWTRAHILDRIDDDLLAYDAQRSTGEPWPFESF